MNVDVNFRRAGRVRAIDKCELYYEQETAILISCPLVSRSERGGGAEDAE